MDWYKNNMYVCVCNAVTEKDIERAVDDGANSFHHLQQKLGVSNNCGSCADEAGCCLQRALEKQMDGADLLSL